MALFLALTFRSVAPFISPIDDVYPFSPHVQLPPTFSPQSQVKQDLALKTLKTGKYDIPNYRNKTDISFDLVNFKVVLLKYVQLED